MDMNVHVFFLHDLCSRTGHLNGSEQTEQGGTAPAHDCCGCAILQELFLQMAQTREGFKDRRLKTVFKPEDLSVFFQDMQRSSAYTSHFSFCQEDGLPVLPQIPGTIGPGGRYLFCRAYQDNGGSRTLQIRKWVAWSKFFSDSTGTAGTGKEKKRHVSPYGCSYRHQNFLLQGLRCLHVKPAQQNSRVRASTSKACPMRNSLLKFNCKRRTETTCRSKLPAGLCQCIPFRINTGHIAGYGHSPAFS